MAQSPLIVASYNGKENIVRALLEDKNINTHKKCANMTALAWAQQENNTDIVTLLKNHSLNKGINI